MNEKNLTRISEFFFEIGTMRKLHRMHLQNLFVDDSSDNISSHSYRVTMIAWFLAKLEGADPYKVLLMALAHDLSEIRSNDHNWVHKKYVKIFEDEIREDQLKTLPFRELFDLSVEYEARESLESKVTKDADLLDQILLLREYEWQGNKEAEKWLRGINRSNELNERKSRKDRFHTESAKKLLDELYDMHPSKWWENMWTNINR